jgi:hypothetical protein
MPEAAMTAMNAPGWWTLGACGLGLVLTLVLAGLLTPRRWWRRPTTGNVALVGAGTLALGFLFASLLPASLPPAMARPALAALRPAAAASHASSAPAPALRYRTIDKLNLRSAKATGAPRLTVLPAGTLVEPTGAIDGDWWEVRAHPPGREVEGWASSLWLRRVDERAVQH